MPGPVGMREHKGLVAIRVPKEKDPGCQILFFPPTHSRTQTVCPPRVGPEGRIPAGLRPGGAVLSHLQAPAQGQQPAALHLLPPGPRGEQPGRWHWYPEPLAGRHDWQAPRSPLPLGSLPSLGGWETAGDNGSCFCPWERAEPNLGPWVGRGAFQGTGC